MKAYKYKECLLFALSLFSFSVYSQTDGGMISGRILSTEKEIVDFATVYLKGTSYGGTTNQEGLYHLKAPAGDYTLVVSAVGYKTVEKPVKLASGNRIRRNVTITPETQLLDEVTIVSSGVSRVKRSAFNAVAVDTKEMQNTTKSLSEALTKAPGMKLRESGGLGSDMQLMLDGFSGKHVKVFIDGVPQEGVGKSFGLNNIPVSFADHIEVYKGVVPVGFGTDAIGGVINIVTNKKRRHWFLDASYSYGSFNTHKSYVNFGQAFKNGFTYEVNAFQNYSDNDYYIEESVEDFETGVINRKEKERVKRFNDTFHNEAIVGKFGVTDKAWADRLMFGFTYSRLYQEIQTGVRQVIVYGQKHREGYSLMPSLEYEKRDLFTKGLNVVLTVNYNKNIRTNVDTASYKYNWRGEKKLLNSPGEQSYLHLRADNDNWNGTLTANYRIGRAQTLTFNHVLNSFHRSSTSLLAKVAQTDPIAKETLKNISGLSYRLMPSENWNFSVFGKYYNQYVAGPIATTINKDDYVRTTRRVSSTGYGAAGTYFVLPGLQAKLSYEKAYRLPTIEEMFGDEDLEAGDIGIKPERSDNLNFNLSYARTFGKHSVYMEGGLVYRNTKDYIQRNITNLSGGKNAATYVNYGRVLTIGYNASVRYGFAKWMSVGGNFTQMNVRDNMRRSISGNTENLAYKERIPNLPYIFADSDLTFYWRGLWKKENTLIFTYDNQYLHSFTFYSSNFGSNKGDYVVPNQLSHNLTLTYSLGNGRYNLSFECRNLTDEKLYDNFSLQRAGRAFYGKVRVSFGN